MNVSQLRLPPSNPTEIPLEDLSDKSHNDKYGKPLINSENNSDDIIENQKTPSLTIPPDIYKTKPVSVTCDNCKRPITTRVVTEFSWGACVFCCCTCFIGFAIVQLCREGTICCCDAMHKCPYCGSLIAHYKVC